MVISRAKIVIRERIEDELEYSEVEFTSLEDLFRLALSEINPTNTDRIVLEGIDDEGRSRTVTLKLQAVTRSG